MLNRETELLLLTLLLHFLAGRRAPVGGATDTIDLNVGHGLVTLDNVQTIPHHYANIRSLTKALLRSAG